MTKGLFCHYLPIYKDINGDYCSTTLTDELFNRYFCVVDKLYIATRVYHINMTYVEAHQEKITLDNVVIMEFPNLSTLRGIAIELRNAKRKLHNIVKNVDLVFIRGGIIALLGAEAARKLKKPYLIECSGCAWDAYWNYNLLGKIIAPYMEYRTKRDVRDASYVIYVTEKWLQNRYPTNGVSTNASNVILNSIDDKVLELRLEKVKKFDHKKIRVGTTGGIGNKAKGQQFVIEAMKRLEEKYDILYELVGEGDSSYLEEIAKKNGVFEKVIFKGQLTHEEVLTWIDSLDFYIQPSLQEGLPRSLIEAMSRGCPAIGSTTAGIPELLDKKFVFKRGSVNDLVKIMKKIFEIDLRENAIRNFNKSKEYQIDLLNDRRTELYKQYLAFVRSGNNT